MNNIFEKYLCVAWAVDSRYNSFVQILKNVRTYTANAYRQTTDKLMFKSVISKVR